MIDKKAFQAWIEAYKQAWISNDPDDIGQLFAEDGRYYTGPFAEPWVGRQGIVSGWLERKDDPGSWEFRYEILAVDNTVGVMRGWTKYLNPFKEYSNLWVMKFNAQGECVEFTEWWMKKK